MRNLTTEMQVNEWKKHWFALGAAYLQCTDPPIRGDLAFLEGYTLSLLSAALPFNSTILEVGSYCGKLTRYLFMGACLSESKVYASEAWLTPLAQGRVEDILHQDVPMTRLDENVLRINTFTMTHSVPETQLSIRSEEPQKAGRLWKESPIGLLVLKCAPAATRGILQSLIPHLEPHAAVAIGNWTGTGNYGVDGPENTIKTLTQSEWKPLLMVGRFRVLTRDQEWWDLRREALRDTFKLEL
jgi:hypothetical protein